MGDDVCGQNPLISSLPQIGFHLTNVILDVAESHDRAIFFSFLFCKKKKKAIKTSSSPVLRVNNKGNVCKATPAEWMKGTPTHNFFFSFFQEVVEDTPLTFSSQCLPTEVEEGRAGAAVVEHISWGHLVPELSEAALKCWNTCPLSGKIHELKWYSWVSSPESVIQTQCHKKKEKPKTWTLFLW